MARRRFSVTVFHPAAVTGQRGGQARLSRFPDSSELLRLSSRAPPLRRACGARIGLARLAQSRSHRNTNSCIRIGAFWDSLILGAQGVCYELKGQQLRMTWEHACLVHEVEQPCPSADNTNNLNFTITLDASNQRVVLTYGTMSAGNRDRQQGATATVGLVNDATGCPVEECALATGLCQDGVTPCGYSQVFSNTVQMPGVQSIQFTPIVDP